MRQLEWWPFYGADFFTDDKVKLMSWSQCGMYVQFLDHQFTYGYITRELGRSYLTSSGKKRRVEEMECAAVLDHCFLPHPSDPLHLINPRMACIRAEQRMKHAERSASGAKGGHAKAASSASSSAIAQPVAQAKLSSTELELDLEEERERRIPELSSLNNGRHEERLMSAEDALDGLIRQSFGHMPH